MHTCRLTLLPRWFWLLLGAGCLVLTLAAVQPWYVPWILVEDPARTASEYLEYQHSHPGPDPIKFPWLAGLVTYLGVLLLCSASAVSWFAARLLAAHGRRSALMGFLIWGGLLSLALGLDDLLMFHEAAKVLWPPADKLFPITYGMMFLFLAWKYLKVILSTRWLVLLCSLLFLGLSELLKNKALLGFVLSIDWGRWGPITTQMFWFEGLKWLGIVLWFGYFMHCSALAMSQLIAVPDSVSRGGSPSAARSRQARLTLVEK